MTAFEQRLQEIDQLTPSNAWKNSFKNHNP